MIEGPRVQLPMECVDRNRPRTPPPPPPTAPPQTELADPDDLAESATDDEAFGCQVHETTTRQAAHSTPSSEDAPQWVCEPHWLTPSMRAEGPIVWVDPEPLRLAGQVTVWLSARFENGSPKS
jgi:hypothetical protein